MNGLPENEIVLATPDFVAEHLSDCPKGCIFMFQNL